ncbi:MAG: TRAP transporter small permease [Desulfatiglandaceae bacterium]
MNTLTTLDNLLARIEGWAIMALVWLMVILTFVQVCLRGLYTHAHLLWANEAMGYLDWTQPFVRLLVLWLTFLGASLLARDNKHIRIDLLFTVLPPKWLPLREAILSAVCAGICGVMVVVCVGYIRMEMTFGGNLFLNVPNWIAQLILPVGFLLLVFRFLVRALNEGLRMVKGMVP